MKNNETDYNLENSKDNLLKTIKMLCFMYLENSDNVVHIDIDKIKEYFKYIEFEYQNMAEFKKSLKIKHYSSPYYEIYSNLDSMILKEHLLAEQSKISFIELTKDVNYLEDILAFCYGVLSAMIKERN